MNANSANHLLLLVAVAGLKLTLLLGIAAAMTRLLRRASAAARHLVWSIAFAGILLLPLLIAILPAWRLPIGLWQRVPALLNPASSASAISEVVGDFGKVTAWPNLERTLDGGLPKLQPNWSTLIIAVWLGGAVAITGRAAFAFWRVRSILVAPSREPAFLRLEQALRECATSLRLRVPVTLRLSDRPFAMPMTWGFARPVVVLPALAARWEEERIHAVMLHELAHVRRGDWLALLISTAACTLFWFHPLVWMAARALRRESECAADDTVVRSGIKPSSYSADLLAIARLAQNANPQNERNHPVIPAIPMANRATIEHRIRALLDRSQTRSGLSRLQILAAMAGGGLTILPLATVTLRAIDPVGQSTSANVALPDRNTPGATINSFVDAFNHGDLRGARACVFGANPAEGSLEFDQQLRQARPRLAVFGVRTATEGDQSIAAIDAGTLTESSHGGETIHSFKNCALNLRRDAGVWRIAPGELKHFYGTDESPLVALVAALGAPDRALRSARATAQVKLCGNNLRQLALAAHIYANDHGGRLDFPAGDAAKALAVYGASEKIASCPQSTPDGQRYKFNANLLNAEIERIGEPSNTVLFYEADAVGTGFQFSHGERTNIVFVDGHVEATSREDIQKLRWRP